MVGLTKNGNRKTKSAQRKKKEERTEKKEEERGRESPHKTEMYYCWYYEIFFVSFTNLLLLVLRSSFVSYGFCLRGRK